MGWWIALAIVVGLAVLPLGVSAKYNASGVWLAIVAGPLRIKILPAKKKEKKPKKEKPKKEKKPNKQKPSKAKQQKKGQGKKTQTAPEPVQPDIPLEEKYPHLDRKPEIVPKAPTPSPEPEKGGSWTDFLSLIPIVLDFLSDFRRKLRVNRLELKLVMASGDPCDLAINYGRAWTAVGNLMPQLERFLHIQKRDVEVECDFTASETKVTARLDLTVTLGRLLAAVIKFAFRALVEYLKITKKRKGGAAK